MFAMTRFLHVANGTSTTMTIEAAGIPGMRSIWADPLHEGPVPGGVSDDELVGVRTQYLGGITTAVRRPGERLREWRAIIARHDAYDELVLWYEHDLFDQLNLIQLLSWIRGRLPAEKRVSLVCIDSFPGRPHFKGLGELSADELRPLLDTRQPVGEAHYALAARAWEAFREPSPEALDAFRRSDTAALPFLAASLVRFLQEYPWTSDGLSRSERRLLELAATEARMLAVAFPRMSEGEHWYHMTDLSLKALADTLSTRIARIVGPVSGERGDEVVQAIGHDHRCGPTRAGRGAGPGRNLWHRSLDGRRAPGGSRRSRGGGTRRHSQSCGRERRSRLRRGRFGIPCVIALIVVVTHRLVARTWIRVGRQRVARGKRGRERLVECGVADGVFVVPSRFAHDVLARSITSSPRPLNTALARYNAKPPTCSSCSDGGITSSCVCMRTSSNAGPSCASAC